MKTFSVGYSEAQFSELTYAAPGRAQPSAPSTTKSSSAMEEFFNALPRLIWHEDEPITWPSSVSLYFVSQLAAEQVKVVLTGEGSDELFAGYGRYRLSCSEPAMAAQPIRGVPAPIRALPSASR